jgi:diguanylate cyclase
MLISIDNISSINHDRGHATGDAVLVHVANELKRLMRQGDYLARYSGAEFAVMMQCSHATGAKRAEYIRQSIAASPAIIDGDDVNVTVSIGMLSCQDMVSQNIEILMQHTHQALQEAKHQGQNRVIDNYIGQDA